MTSIVEIEITTLDLLFKNLESDVKLLQMAIVKKWENGKEHYRKRIERTVNGLRKVDSMIDSIIESFHKDIQYYKNFNTFIKSEAAITDYDENSVLEIRKKVLKVKKDMKKKLEELKSIHWERDMRVSGFNEFELEPDLSDTAIKRTDDGVLHIHNLDKGTVITYDN
jgi:hypothetical protein